MARNSVAIRIGTEGKATVIRDFAEIGDAGTVQSQRIKAKWEGDVAAVERAVERMNKTQQRLAAVSTSPTGPSNTINPITAGNYNQSNNAAMRSAQALSQELDRAENEARQLLAAIDPLFAAQQRYGTAVGNLDRLLAQGALSEERYIQLLRAEEAALEQASIAQRRHAQASGLQRAGYQQLSFQITDVTQQLALGTSGMIIAAQQGPQVAQAMSMIGDGAEGAGKKVGGASGMLQRMAGVMMTPWGAAITGGMLILGMFISKLVETGETLDSEIEKLRENAEKTEQTRRAKEAFERTLPGLIERIREETAALEQQNRTLAENQRLTLQTAQSQLNNAIGEQARVSGQLGRTRDDLRAAEARFAALSDGGAVGVRVAAAAEVERLRADVSALEGQVRSADQAVEGGRRGIDAAQFQIARTQAEALVDPLVRINQQFDAMIARARTASRSNGIVLEMGAAGVLPWPTLRRGTDRNRLTNEIADINRRREAALEAQQTARRRTPEQAFEDFRRELAARNIQQAAGRSGFRSAADQHDQFRSGASPLDGYRRRSRHQNWQALDPTRASHDEQEAQEAAMAAGLRGFRVVRESGGRFHYEWTGHGRSGEVDVTSQDRGRSREEAIRRQNEALEESTRRLLAEARANLTSGEAALRAQAAREGATAATRRGTEVSAQVARQLAHDVAEGAARGAEEVRLLEEELAARRALTDRMIEQGLSAEEMNRQLANEGRLRPLLQLQAVAQGESYALLTEEITRMRAALAGLHEEERRSEGAQAIRSVMAANDNARLRLGLTGSDQERRLGAVAMEAGREAGEKGWNPAQSAVYALELLDAEQLAMEEERGEQVRRINADMDDRAALLRAELGLGFMGEAQSERILRAEAMRLDLQRQFGPGHEAEIQQLLAKARATDDLVRRVEQVRDAQRQVQQVGEQLIDEVFNIDNWSDWGEAGKRIINMLIQEMLTLAAINPLKNMLFGQNNPTIGSVLQAIGAIGGAAAGGSNASSMGAFMGKPGFAAGTHYAPGGLAWLAENGPEMVHLPRGSKVTPAADTRRLLAANDRGIGTISLTFNNDFRGADPAAVAQLEADQRRMESELPARVVAAFEDARARHVVR